MAKTQDDPAIKTIIFKDPKANCLSSSVIKSIRENIAEAARDTQIKVIVLRSEGKTFCAGASFDELKAAKTEEEAVDFFRAIGALFWDMISCPKIILTCVQGKAVGGGVGLIAASDYVIATSSAEVRLSELEIGIGPFIIGPLISRTVGERNFQAMTLDTEFRSAEWCLEKGLFGALAKEQKAMDSLRETLARKLAAAPLQTLTELKKIFWAGCDDWGVLFAKRAETVGILWAQKASGVDF